MLFWKLIALVSIIFNIFLASRVLNIKITTVPINAGNGASSSQYNTQQNPEHGPDILQQKQTEKSSRPQKPPIQKDNAYKEEQRDTRKEL